MECHYIKEDITIIFLILYLFDVLVLRDCDCTPFFHTLGARKCPRLCHGPSLLCMNKILDQIGEYREVEVETHNNKATLLGVLPGGYLL